MNLSEREILESLLDGTITLEEAKMLYEEDFQYVVVDSHGTALTGPETEDDAHVSLGMLSSGTKTGLRIVKYTGQKIGKYRA